MYLFTFTEEALKLFADSVHSRSRSRALPFSARDGLGSTSTAYRPLRYGSRKRFYLRIDLFLDNPQDSILASNLGKT